LVQYKKVDATNDGVPCKWAGCECPTCASEVEWANHVNVHLEEVKEIFSTTTLANNPSSAMPIQTRSNPHMSASMETGASLSDQRLLTDRPSQAFKVYRWRWLGCKALLHNFDNRKRHLKKHKKVDTTNDGVPCKWAGCECPRCASEVEWANHVHVHLEEVKEIFGLGPATLTSGNSQVSASQGYTN
jgi:glutaredoxin-related protein